LSPWFDMSGSWWVSGVDTTNIYFARKYSGVYDGTINWVARYQI
jgi:hypothetical protein